MTEDAAQRRRWTFYCVVNVKRGKRKKAEQDEILPCLIEESGVSPEKRKAWARLIQKIYEVDPLTCPRCQGSLRIIAFIEQEEVIKKNPKTLMPVGG